ncbi:VOC family protein [Pseudonocardia acidicola]|uniref:VOC family protein n=1 Tax=Pseudonocardia acidicola TaxID=2724939 RepID=A0ABX1SB75_9PSEU|nr:VOC family protein [Pseudonocardia acidicola]NMH97621.1 VOC family protein [Pseudonocardia acidicola]
MADSGFPTPGTIAWLDLMTDDVEVAERFYTGVLGWTYATAWTPLGDYGVARVGDRDVAGLMTTDPGVPGPASAWEVFVEVASIQMTLASVRAAGGTVLQEAVEVPGGGRIGVFADPTGAVLAVVESPPGAGPPASGVPGGFAGVELRSADPEVARAFYTAVLGWRTERSLPDRTTFLLEGSPVAGLAATSDEVASSRWLACFAVADIDEALLAAAQRGGWVAGPVTVTSTGRMAVVEDPRGAWFALVEPAGVAG